MSKEQQVGFCYLIVKYATTTRFKYHVTQTSSKHKSVDKLPVVLYTTKPEHGIKKHKYE